MNIQRLRISIFFSVLLSFLYTDVWSQAPAGFKYQAVIRDVSGEIVANQTIAMQITILQGSADGTSAYQETFTPESNVFGLVNLAIGSGTVVTGDFSVINWSQGPYFVQIGLDLDGGSNFTVMGTSQLLSVPYALHANTVQNDADNQKVDKLNLNGSTLELSLENDGEDDLSVDLSSLSTALTEAEVDAFTDNNGYLTIEDQTLSFDNGTGQLTITEGNTITLPAVAGGDNWGSQVVESDATLTGNGSFGNPLGVVGALTDDQQLSLSGNLLDIEDGNQVDLSAIDTDTHLSEAEVETFITNGSLDLATATTLNGEDISTGNHTTALDWTAINNKPAGFDDDTDDVDDADASATNEIQDLQLAGDILTITANGTALVDVN